MNRLALQLATWTVFSCAFLYGPTKALAEVAQETDDEELSRDPVLGATIAQAAAFEGRLWLRGWGLSEEDSSGGLISLDSTSGERRVEFERGVHDLQRSTSGLWLLRTPETRPAEVLVSKRRGSAWSDVTTIRLEKGEFPIVLQVREDGFVVLTSRAVQTYDPLARLVRSRRLDGVLHRGVQSAIASPSRGGTLFVGVNVGEFGGGLFRIDPTTGKVTAVERRDSAELCAGPLNAECDPVTGVIADPVDGACVLATVGLSHFGAHGRVLRICDDRVDVVFEQSTPVSGWSNEDSVPFFGLAPDARGGFWAVGRSELFHLGSGLAVARRLPEPFALGGIHLSCEIPGVVVLLTGINRPVSLSGYTPLVVPLDPGMECPGWIVRPSDAASFAAERPCGATRHVIGLGARDSRRVTNIEPCDGAASECDRLVTPPIDPHSPN